MCFGVGCAGAIWFLLRSKDARSFPLEQFWMYARVSSLPSLLKGNRETAPWHWRFHAFARLSPLLFRDDACSSAPRVRVRRRVNVDPLQLEFPLARACSICATG